MCHDCNPDKEIYQCSFEDHFDTGEPWVGTVWEAIVSLRATRSDLEIYVVDTDYGCGVIRKGTSTPIVVPTSLTYMGLEVNRKSWLGLISVADFWGVLISSSRYV